MQRLTVWAAQIVVFALSGVMAFLLRFDFVIPAAYRGHLIRGLLIWIVVKAIVFRLAKLDRGLWRYVSANDLIRLASGNVVASSVSCILILLSRRSGSRDQFTLSIYSRVAWQRAGFD